MNALSKDISSQLIRVYEQTALDFEKSGEYEKSLEYYDKCLDAFKRTGDEEQEAKCYYKMGLIFEQINDMDKAILYLNKYLQQSLSLNNFERVSEAYKLLADKYKKIGKLEESKNCLEKLLDVKVENKDIVLKIKAEAALKLGTLEYEAGHVSTAVTFLEKNFDMAREIKDKQYIDKAKINLGIAKAYSSLEIFKSIVKNDQQAFLNWKIKRIMQAPQ